MGNLLRCIYACIENLRIAINYDVYDLSREQQEAMLNRLDEIQTIVDKVKEGTGQ